MQQRRKAPQFSLCSPLFPCITQQNWKLKLFVLSLQPNQKTKDIEIRHEHDKTCHTKSSPAKQYKTGLPRVGKIMLYVAQLISSDEARTSSQGCSHKGFGRLLFPAGCRHHPETICNSPSCQARHQEVLGPRESHIRRFPNS